MSSYLEIDGKTYVKGISGSVVRLEDNFVMKPRTAVSILGEDVYKSLETNTTFRSWHKQWYVTTGKGLYIGTKRISFPMVAFMITLSNEDFRVLLKTYKITTNRNFFNGYYYRYIKPTLEDIQVGKSKELEQVETIIKEITKGL